MILRFLLYLGEDHLSNEDIRIVLFSSSQTSLRWISNALKILPAWYNFLTH